MSLISAMMSPFVMLDKHTSNDGAGGVETTWTEGARFEAVAVIDTSLEAQIADRDDLSKTYVITTSKAVVLQYNDHLRRLSDGAVFRVTSDQNDRIAPAVSTLDIAQVKAVKVVLP